MRRVVVGVVVGVLLVGCGARPGPAPGSGSSSVVTVSPSGSGSPTLDPVVVEAEAIRVYRAYFELEQKLFAQGGVDKLPEEMRQYLEPDSFTVVEVGLQHFKQSGARLEGGVARLVGPRKSDRRRSDAVIILESCSDSRHVTVHEQGKTTQGYIVHDITYFRYSDGLLKRFDNEFEKVDTCPVG